MPSRPVSARRRTSEDAPAVACGRRRAPTAGSVSRKRPASAGGWGGSPMSKRAVLGLVAVLALTAAVVGVSKAAAPKDYQFTGTVTEVDAKSKTISVDKGGDVWGFSTKDA